MLWVNVNKSGHKHKDTDWKDGTVFKTTGKHFIQFRSDNNIAINLLLKRLKVSNQAAAKELDILLAKW